MSQSEKERRAAQLAVPERKSGRAVFDEGRTVWEWQTATGVFERHVSDEQLSRLEASDLRLVEQAPAKDAGRAIYSSGAVAGNNFTTRTRTQSSRSNVGAFRQFWRRLVLAG